MTDKPVAADDTLIDSIGKLLTGPVGLFVQLVAIGYISAAFVLYPFRRRVFHPDVLNVYGAIAGAAVWAVVEASTVLMDQPGADAIPAPAASLVAVLAFGAIYGRGHWLVVARRNEDRRESLTKWEYKTKASFATLLAMGGAIAAIAAPLPTAVIAVVLAAALFMPFGERTLIRLLRDSLSEPPAPEAAPGEARITRYSPAAGLLTAFADREDELVVGVTDHSGSRWDAAEVTAALVEATAAALSGEATAIKRVRVGIAELVNAEPTEGGAVNDAVSMRVREAAASVEGISVVEKPLIHMVERGWRAVIAVATNPQGADERARACALAVHEAHPWLAVISVCRDVESGAGG